MHEIVLEWLHQGCDSDLSADFLNFGQFWRVRFSFQVCFKSASKSSFFALVPGSGFGVAISDVAVRISIVFCNSVCAVMVASRLLGAAAACVIVLSFAPGHGKSYWSGCIKAAILICQQIFPILALVILL